MHPFNIDTQTFKDLNIFAANDGSNSLFNLFKNTRTVGARERLREIMQSPSADLKLITLRRDAIKYFHDHGISLDVRNEEVDLIEYYLKSKIRKFRNNPIDSLSDYVTRNTSNNFYIIKTGLKYLIKLSKFTISLIKEHTSNQTPQYLNLIFKQIEEIVETGILKQALLLDEERLSFLDVTRIDRRLRGAEEEKMKTLLQLIYELDVLENIAIVGARNGFSFPVYSAEDNLKLNIRGLFHPSIGNPVKNDVYVDINHNLIFLTGSNMSGKSSLLKAIGLVIYLSHLGFPVPADRMETTIFNGLVTTINLPDDINQGLSHYYSEVKRVKEVSQILLDNDKMFVIFDELFRGTNVKDAFDGSSLIISELSNIKNSAFLISTHIVELAEVLTKFENISFQYLDTHFDSDKPVFTYHLTKGISKERLGMYIVQNEGIVEILRQAANKTKPPYK